MKQQFAYYLGSLAYLPLLPLLYVQARRVRAVVPRLPEADGVEGRSGDGPDPLRLLTFGESTVAGVGMPHHREGLTGWLAHHVAERTGRGVRWTVVGRSGVTAAQAASELVPSIPPERFDLIVIALGGNDTFSLNTPRRWKRDMIALIHAIRARQPQAPIVIANLPPVGDFPAFPPLMQRFLGRLVRLHGDAIADLPSRFPDVLYVSRRIRLDEWVERMNGTIRFADLFVDGVHPSSLTYRLWAEEIVEHARQRGALDGRAALTSPVLPRTTPPAPDRR